MDCTARKVVGERKGLSRGGEERAVPRGEDRFPGTCLPKGEENDTLNDNKLEQRIEGSHELMGADIKKEKLLGGGGDAKEE